jgi:hypothetical protein
MMPFKPGQSGNPAGKKPGTRHRGTQMAEDLLRDTAGDIWEAVVNRAMEGDPAMIKLVLERVMPPWRGQRLNLAKYLAAAANDWGKVQVLIANEMLSGVISPQRALARSEAAAGSDSVNDEELRARLAELKKATASSSADRIRRIILAAKEEKEWSD